MWNHMGMIDGFDGWGWGWMLLGALHMVAVWALVIGAVWLLFRSFGRARGSDRPNALEILDERYARGEIDRTEYEQRRSDIIGR
jgi:putative membrane protein